MAPRPTVIGSRVIGVDLPAFLLSKSFYSESIGMPRTAALQLPRIIASGDSVWWDLSGRVAQPRLPALPTSASAEFLLSCLRALRLASEFPCGNSPLVYPERFEGSLAANHCRKIKNPASSAGYSHPYLGGSTRCSTSF